MCVFGNKARTLEEGREKCMKAVSDGSALDLFYKNVELQGGNVSKLEKEIGKRRSPHKRELVAEKDGYIYIEAYKTGVAGCSLGVGRNRTDEDVCPDAGMILRKVSGDKVRKGDVIMEVYGRDEKCFDFAMPLLNSAVTYSDTPDNRIHNPLVLKTITG